MHLQKPGSLRVCKVSVEAEGDEKCGELTAFNDQGYGVVPVPCVNG